MSIFTKAQGGSQNPLVRFFMILVALVFVAPVQGAKWLNRKVYDGDFFDGLGAAVLGLAAGVGAAIQVGSYLGAAHSWLVYIPGGVGAFLAAVFYAFPVAYLVAIKPLWKAARHIWDGIGNFCRSHAQSVAARVVSALSLAPGSGSAWQSLTAKAEDNWFVSLIGAATHVSIACGTSYLGYSIYSWAHHLAPIASTYGLAATIGGGVVGVLTTAFLWSALAKFVHYGKVQGLAIVLGAGLTGGAAFYFAHSLSALTIGIAGLAGFALFITYAFPLICLVMSNGFWARLWKRVEPLIEKAYDDGSEAKPARRLFHQVLNLGVAAAVVFFGLALCAAIALPVWATYLALAVSAVLSYAVIGKALDWEGGNYLTGALAAVATGVKVGVTYTAHGLIYGVYGATAVGFLSAAAVFCLAFPCVVLAYEYVAGAPVISTLVGLASSGLVKVHTFVWGKFEKLWDVCEELYNYGYRDERPYNKLIEHVANLALTAFGAYWLHVLTHGLSVYLAIPAVVLGTALTYLLGGKLLLHKYGIELVGSIASLIGLVALGSAVDSAQQFGMTLAAPVAVVFGFFSYTLIFPALFIAVRYVADPLFTGWLLPVLGGIYDFGWKRFGKVWDAFVAVYNAVVSFLSPYFGGLFRFLAGAWNALKGTWNAMFGHKK